LLFPLNFSSVTPLKLLMLHAADADALNFVRIVWWALPAERFAATSVTWCFFKISLRVFTVGSEHLNF
jgi:hypothetical protein